MTIIRRSDPVLSDQRLTHALARGQNASIHGKAEHARGTVPEIRGNPLFSESNVVGAPGQEEDGRHAESAG